MTKNSVTNRTRELRRASAADPDAALKGSPQRTFDVQQRALVALEGLVAVSGVGGGVYMATHPLTTMSLTYLEGTWFHTWRWPGLALLFFVGFCPVLSIAATFLRHRMEMVGHFAVGVGLVAWIVIEVAWIVVSPGLQIAFAVIGVIIISLAISEAHRRKEDEQF